MLPCHAMQAGPGEFLQAGDKPAPGVTCPCSKQGTEHAGTDAVRWTLQSCIEPPKGNRDGEKLCQKVPKAVPCCRNDAEQAAFWLLPDRVGFGGVPLPGNKLCSRFWCLPDSLCPWAGLELCRWVSWGSPAAALCPGNSPPTSPSPLSFPPTVTSEQIEHLHRRFKQLSRDQLTIRYGASISTVPPGSGQSITRAGEGCLVRVPSNPGCENERVLAGHPRAKLSWLSEG